MKKLLSAATATGNGSAIKLESPNAFHGVEIVLNGTISTLSFDLKGSISGNFWGNLASYTMSTTELLAGGVVFHVADKMVEHVMPHVSDYAGASGSSIDVYYTPYPSF
jgi:hypothetical protein